MPPDESGMSYLLGVECKEAVCGTFFATPLRVSPDAYARLPDCDAVHRCPRCCKTRRYGKQEHVFVLLDAAAWGDASSRGAAPR